MRTPLLPPQVREIIPFESRFAEVCGHRLHLTADEHAVVEHAGEPGPAEEVERDLWLRRRVDSRMRLADNLRRR